MFGNGALTREELLDVIKAAGGAHVLWRPVGGVGDEVMKLPAYTAFKEKIGDELLIAAVVDYIEPVVRYHPAVDYVLKMSPIKDKAMCEDDRRYMAQLEMFNCELTRFSFPCPAARYESEAGSNIVKSRQQIWCEHLDVEFDIGKYNFTLLQEELDAAADLDLGDRYIAVQPRCYGKWRDYPRMRWLLKELVRLGKQLDFRVVTIDRAEYINMRGVINIVKADLRLVFAVIARSLLFIGPDSMGCHVAGALNIPLLGLFGPTNPAVRLKYKSANWMPRYDKCSRQYCWYRPCGVRRKEHRKVFKFCLSALSAKDIVDVAECIVTGGRENAIYGSWRE